MKPITRVWGRRGREWRSSKRVLWPATTAWAPLYALLSPVLTVAPEAKNSPYLGVQVGWPILAAALLALLHVIRSMVPRPAARVSARSLRTPGAWMMTRLLVALSFAFFIVWSPVDFWRYVPRLFYNLQITYRILMFVILWGSVLAGMALAAFWRGTTRFRDQAGLRLRIQLGLCPGARPFLQRLQALFDKALARAFDRGAPNREGGSDDAVLRALGGFEQDTGTGHFAGRVRPTMQ